MHKLDSIMCVKVKSSLNIICDLDETENYSES